MAEPTSITAGDTCTWTRSEADYPASAGWTLTYYLSLGAAAPKTVTASASGDDHAVTITAATSGGWAAGVYQWSARVSKAGEIHTVGSGVLTVLPDPSATLDKRTHAEKCLAAIEAALEGRVGDSILEYQLDGGLSVKHLPPYELARLHALYQAKVRRERGGSAMRTIQVRLNRA